MVLQNMHISRQEKNKRVATLDRQSTAKYWNKMQETYEKGENIIIKEAIYAMTKYSLNYRRPKKAGKNAATLFSANHILYSSLSNLDPNGFSN